MKKMELRLPTLVGLVVAVGGLISGLYLLRGQLGTALSATAEERPKEVRVTNISDVEFSVSWVTDKATSGFVQFGESPAKLEMTVSDDRDQERGGVGNYYTHHTTVKGLKPGQEYAFRLGSGRSLYDAGGEVYKATTAGSVAQLAAADMAFGQVVNANGEPAEGAVVYLQMRGGAIASALVKPSGSWVIPLSTVRTEDLTGLLAYDKEKQRLDLTVQGANLGVANVATTTKNDGPVPTITLGKDYDYITGLSGEGVASDSAQAVTSKFGRGELATATETKGGDTLLILSPRFGEEVNNLRPQIIGRGKPGTTVTVEIHSEEGIVGTARVGADGTFSYTVPQNLGPGEHTISATSVVNGVVNRVVRSFVVVAAGSSDLPAFTATPSATLVPKPTATPLPTQKPSPTPTIKPLVTPKPTATAAPTAIPRVVYPATPSAVPVAGEAWPTWVFMAVGIALVLGGGYIYRRGGAGNG